SGAGGLTRLSVRWAKMGIVLERIWPGKPQQNGRHERMHRTLKAETCRPPAANAADQQARFDDFRAEFNDERPHQALGQLPAITPEVRASSRPFLNTAMVGTALTCRREARAWASSMLTLATRMPGLS